MLCYESAMIKYISQTVVDNIPTGNSLSSQLLIISIVIVRKSGVDRLQKHTQLFSYVSSSILDLSITHQLAILLIWITHYQFIFPYIQAKINSLPSIALVSTC